MQDSGCIAAQVKDMKVMTAAAPSNPITPVTYTGFQFAPKQDYYQAFQGGVLAKLAEGHSGNPRSTAHSRPALAVCLSSTLLAYEQALCL